LIDSSGTNLESYRYEAFGKPGIHDAAGNLITESAYGNRFMFTGREFIPVMGIYDYRNRVYSIDFGRFLQNDPIRFKSGDVNLYRYVWNSPIVFIGSEGLFAVPPSVVIVIVGGTVIILYEWVFGTEHANDVSERAEKQWPGDPLQNAMRHCVWQCELTQKRGSSYAELAGWMHELSAPNDLDQQADLANNQCGRELGSYDQVNCEQECENLWENEDLMSNK
jgi:RHS repeat-associated protein